ncbi:hypothetical protein J6590_078595 [Homalodisca vitripennis]|nr:hypothetical protein J6590_078595 [Homalodisca vitripennis]
MKVAEKCNQYFSYVGSNLANANDSSGPPVVDDTDYATYSTFTLHTVTEDDLQRHVNQLCGSSAPGYDGISASFLKDNINSQYGFRKSRNTAVALFCFNDDINEAVSSNRRCLLVFLDLAKAFDSLFFRKLLVHIHKRFDEIFDEITHDYNTRNADNVGIRVPRLLRTYSTTNPFIIAHYLYRNIPEDLQLNKFYTSTT